MEAIANLVRLAPIVSMLVAIIGSGGGAGLVAWNGRGWLFETFERPAIVKGTQDADAAIYEAAADAAKKARELEIFRTLEQITNHYYQQQVEDQAWNQAQLDQAQQEINDYEAGIADPETRRKICGLTQHDLDFLGSLRPDPR